MSDCSDIGSVFTLLVAGYLIVSEIKHRQRHRGLDERLRQLGIGQQRLRESLDELQAKQKVGSSAEGARVREAPIDREPAEEVPLETTVVPKTDVHRAPSAAAPTAPLTTGEVSRPPPVVIPPPPAVPSSSRVPPPPSIQPASELPPAPAIPTQQPPPAPPSSSPSTWSPPSINLRQLDWESLVGVKLFSWVAGVALLFAAVFFLRYSMEHGWLSTPVRMAIGLVTGIVLLVVCELPRAQRYRVTAQSLDAAGIAILFSTLFAAHALWHLLDTAPTFALMALVAAVAVVLSIRRESIFIALLGLVGGFATPALLSTGEDRPFSLFSYLLLLNVALAWVAYRKRWPLLTAASLALTTFYQAGWVVRFFHASQDAGKVPLAMSIFLIFPIAGFGALLLSRRSVGGQDPLFARTATVGAFPPILFALYLACVPAYGSRFGLLFGLLFLVAAGLAAVAALLGPEWLHLTGAGSVLLVFACWLGLSYTSRAWPWVLLVLALFVALYLVVPLLLKRLGRAFREEAQLGVYAAPLLLFAFPALVWLEPQTQELGLFFGALLVLLIALAVHAVALEDGRSHCIAGFAALAAQVAWSAKYLTPERLLPALLVYAGLALFHLAVPLVAERRGKQLRPAGSGAILLFASLALLFLLTSGAIAHASLWALAVLLLILPAGLLFEAARGHYPFLAPIGIAVSWLVLIVWWIAAPLMVVGALLVQALIVIAGFALLALGGSLWAEHRSERKGLTEAARQNQLAALFGLAGHGFLLVVAAQPRLAVPPWPWLAILGLLDLALLVASLWVRRGLLHLFAVAGSVVLLGAYVTSGSPHAPGPTVATGAALVLALFALAAYRLAVRRAVSVPPFVWAAEAALFGGQLVAVAGSVLGGSPSLVVLVGFHLLMVAGILWFAGRTARPWDALVAVATCALAVLGWRLEHPEDFTGVLCLATPLYLVLLFHPFASRCLRTGRLYYLSSVAASAVYFLFAREALVQAGFGYAIGLLPIAQAFLLVPHLWFLVRKAPPVEHDSARVALVAAAVLAFVTVAIPLQLEKQWITLGWALQAAALAWLYLRIPHRGLVVWLAGLLLAVFIRLTVNPAVLAYHPRSAMPVLNWYLYTYLVAAACFFLTARWLARSDDRLLPGTPRVSAFLPAMGGILLFLLLNLEIADFWSQGPHITFDFSAGLAQDLSYTIGWGLFAIGMLVVGVVARSRATRIASIALLVVTVAKAFVHDLKNLSGLYRVGSLLGLAICLTLMALVLQRFVLSPSKEKR